MTAKLEGYGEKDKWQISYSQLGKRRGERAETKVVANTEHFEKYFIMQSL
jgi:hypothetical protein